MKFLSNTDDYILVVLEEKPEGWHLGKTGDGYVRAIRVPFSYLKSLSKGYKFTS